MLALYLKIIIVIIFIALVVIVIILYKAYKITLEKHHKLFVKHKVNIQNLEKEVLLKNQFAKNQLEEMMTQNIEITESIIYARKIQKAVLTPDSLFETHFKEYFILFKPKQIVSGDFYWLAEKKKKIYLTAADCTGHGVPGAFMSLLGISFLNEIINKNEIVHANQILGVLRDHIINSLHQTGKIGGSKDGMDMSLCVIDKEKRQIEFAGAYNPLFILRERKECEDIENCPFDEKVVKIDTTDEHMLIHIKPDRMPVGFDYRKEGHSFSNHLIDLKPNDTIYLFSDGYSDQFGGEKNKKFSLSRFKSLLLKIQEYELEEQNYILDDTHEEWKGKYSQIDDILIIGYKV